MRSTLLVNQGTGTNKNVNSYGSGSPDPLPLNARKLQAMCRKGNNGATQTCLREHRYSLFWMRRQPLLQNSLTIKVIV